MWSSSIDTLNRGQGAKEREGRERSGSGMLFSVACPLSLTPRRGLAQQGRSCKEQEARRHSPCLPLVFYFSRLCTRHSSNQSSGGPDGSLADVVHLRTADSASEPCRGITAAITTKKLEPPTTRHDTPRRDSRGSSEEPNSLRLWLLGFQTASRHRWSATHGMDRNRPAVNEILHHCCLRRENTPARRPIRNANTRKNM